MIDHCAFLYPPDHTAESACKSEVRMIEMKYGHDVAGESLSKLKIAGRQRFHDK